MSLVGHYGRGVVSVRELADKNDIPRSGNGWAVWKQGEGKQVRGSRCAVPSEDGDVNARVPAKQGAHEFP